MRVRQSAIASGRSTLLPEDIGGRFLDFDPGLLSTVWQDSARTVPGAADQPVGALDCRLSGWTITQSDEARLMTLESGNGGRLWQHETLSKHLGAASLPSWLPAKLRAPLTIAWWIKPEVVPVAGNPNYQWEFYNTAEAGVHLNFQYRDPNDASEHKQFIPTRRRSDTTGTNTITTRVDDGIYPNASIGTWAMLAMVHDGDPIDSRWFMSMNGTRVGAATGIASFYQGLTTNASFWLGCRNVTGNYARARFRRWVAWDRALSEAELHKLWTTTNEAWGLASLS